MSVQAKIGPIRIGSDSDIGMHSVIHSQGGVDIGAAVVLGGGCKISGGVFQTARSSAAGGGEMSAREQTRWTKGPIRIGDRCLIGFGCLFLDGVEIGEGAVIGAGSVMTASVPAWSIAAGVPGRVLSMRESHSPGLSAGRGRAMTVLVTGATGLHRQGAGAFLARFGSSGPGAGAPARGGRSPPG